MTDKELRKLSRLELLELLLEASKENEKLKGQIKDLQAENETTQNIEKLSKITGQVESTLTHITGVFKAGETRGSLKSTDATDERVNKKNLPPDVELYKALLSFFANNDDKLEALPSELAGNIRARIKIILERKNN